MRFFFFLAGAFKKMNKFSVLSSRLDASERIYERTSKKLWGTKGMLENIGQGKADQDKADKKLCIYTEIIFKDSVITQR